jgi:hypothetical protein
VMPMILSVERAVQHSRARSRIRASVQGAVI